MCAFTGVQYGKRLFVAEMLQENKQTKKTTTITKTTTREWNLVKIRIITFDYAEFKTKKTKFQNSYFIATAA